MIPRNRTGLLLLLGGLAPLRSLALGALLLSLLLSLLFGLPLGGFLLSLLLGGLALRSLALGGLLLRSSFLSCHGFVSYCNQPAEQLDRFRTCQTVTSHRKVRQ